MRGKTGNSRSVPFVLFFLVCVPPHQPTTQKKLRMSGAKSAKGMQARWLPGGVVDHPEASKSWKNPAMNVRIERYAVNSGGSPLYFVRAEMGGAERTASLKFEEFRAVHRRLAEDGGVLYATNGLFPRPPRKARLGLRLTPAEMNEQCEALNSWLRATAEDVEVLPLGCQKELRQFLGFEGAEPPPWTTAKKAGGLFSGQRAGAPRKFPRKPDAIVYPLGQGARLPGVTRRGRLECRDANNQWLSVHVILTHLSLLVFQPVDDQQQQQQQRRHSRTSGGSGHQASAAPVKLAPTPSTSFSDLTDPAIAGFGSSESTTRTSGALSIVSDTTTTDRVSFGYPSAATTTFPRSTSVPANLTTDLDAESLSPPGTTHPFAAALLADTADDKKHSDDNDDDDDGKTKDLLIDSSESSSEKKNNNKTEVVQVAEKISAAATTTTKTTKDDGGGLDDYEKHSPKSPSPLSTKEHSAGRLLHNLHVTDILSILRHGDNESMGAPPIHHRCFSIGDLNDDVVTLRTVNARDCIQWLKAISRAKDRALAAVHRLDDKSHGHELVLATRRRDSSDERIVARNKKKGPGYGWFEAFRVHVKGGGTLRFELNAGDLELPIASLLARAADDAGNSLGAATSASAAEANGDVPTTRGSFWAPVALHSDEDRANGAAGDESDADSKNAERLELLVAVDARDALDKGFQRRSLIERTRNSRVRALARLIRRGLGAARKVLNDKGLPAIQAALASRVGAIAVAVLSCYLVAKLDNKASSSSGKRKDDDPEGDEKNNNRVDAVFLEKESRLLLAKEDNGEESSSKSRFVAVLLRAADNEKKFLGRIFLSVDFARLVVYVVLAVVFFMCALGLYFYEDEVEAEEDMEQQEFPLVVADALAAASEESTMDVRLVNWRWRDAEQREKKKQPAPKKEAQPAETKQRWWHFPFLRGQQYHQQNAQDYDKKTTVELTQKAPEEEEEDLSLPKKNEEDELPEEVPLRFLGAVRGDLAAAQKRWAETLAFREAGNKPEEVLRRPQPNFHKIKARHRHFLHKRDKLGHTVAFEVVNTPNRTFKELEKEGITVEDVVNHMHFVSAYTYVKVLDDVDEIGKRPKAPEGYFLKIIDLKHIGLGDCGGETARFFRLVTAINRHYPERVWKTIIVNAPSIFGVIWTIVSPLLEPNVREKITVLRSNFKDTLRDLIDPDDLPAEYGGNDDSLSPEEIQMAAYADDLNEKSKRVSFNETNHYNEAEEDDDGSNEEPASLEPPPSSRTAFKSFRVSAASSRGSSAPPASLVDNDPATTDANPPFLRSRYTNKTPSSPT